MDTTESTQKRPLAARILLWPLLAGILIHTLIIGLWSAPHTVFREAVGNERVREYVLPWFEQNWSIFAPTPRRAEVIFEVRAHILPEDGSEGIVTEWVELTETENALLPGNIAPPRAILLTRRVADRMNSARADMNNEQVEILELHFYETPIEDLRRMLLEADGAHRGAVDRYMRTDAMATLIASGYAELAWADQGEITRVQYRTSSRRVPAYDQREERTVSDVDPVVRDYGWRQSLEISEEELVHFEYYLPEGTNSDG